MTVNYTKEPIRKRPSLPTTITPKQNIPGLLDEEIEFGEEA